MEPDYVGESFCHVPKKGLQQNLKYPPVYLKDHLTEQIYQLLQ